ncbi:hypothetical protein [Nocardiopsis listeri]|uniref:hypothetical protein n=1 Tax=Nocardiopsis listeri TaxID=53440 RepID=UPI00082BD11C|nr:hypothetical protein [Nocardiopsis listeri]
MAPRYLNQSGPASVPRCTEEVLRQRRPRRASRVRAYAHLWPATRTPHIPQPRPPMDDLPLLLRVLDGLHRIPVAA